MKRILHLTVLVLLAASCDNDNDNEETNPKPQTTLVPIKMEDIDGSRELLYDNEGKITGLSIITHFVDGTKTTNIQTLIYDPAGVLLESNMDTGWRVVYTYNEKKQISKTEEYEKGVWSQRHVYTYYPNGLLKESITYKDIQGEGGIIPVTKDEYLYDHNENVTSQFLYDYTAFGAEAKILTTFTFSDYDAKINTEEYFNIHPFNPFITLRKNNPGKMVTRNVDGIISSVETYRYKYNSHGYATEKTTFVKLYNGSTGSYTTQYAFKD